MVDMTKHPLHYSWVLVMPLLFLDLWPLEMVNMIITYSSGLLQKVSMRTCVQHRELWTAPSAGLSFATVLGMACGS